MEWIAAATCLLAVAWLVWMMVTFDPDREQREFDELRALHIEKNTPPEERIRKQYLELRKTELTGDDLEWIADQYKLTGVDPTKRQAFETYPKRTIGYRGGFDQ